MMESMLIVGAVSLLVGCAWLYVSRSRAGSRHPVPFELPPGVTLASAPLLAETDVLLYNLMRLAVQDHYLVFAQVPLWSFISVEAMGTARSQVLHHMALKRVDFVLVHPGSRQVEKVVQIEDAPLRPHQRERQRVIRSVLGAVGIELVNIRSQQSYTVPALASLLGLDLEE